MPKGRGLGNCCVSMCVCLGVCVCQCLPYSFFCVCLPFVCVHGWQRTCCHAPSALPLWQAACVCMCLCVRVCVCVYALWARVWVFVCEILCVPVRLRESGCEKTSACLSESACPGSSLLYEQDSAVVSCVSSVCLCVHVCMCVLLSETDSRRDIWLKCIIVKY